MIIGITGIFGSGKSTVAGMFRKHGFTVIDADKVAHAAIRKGSSEYDKAVSTFGKNILKCNREIDRKRLAAIVFSDSKKLENLNRIVHPAVISKIRKQLKNGNNLVLDAPLLIESGLAKYADKVIVLKAKKPIIVKRLLEKGYTKRLINNISRSQMPLREKLKYADYIIDNSGTFKETEKQVKGIIKDL